MTTAPGATVARYLDRMTAHDWAGMAECLHPDVVRIGPFGDTYTPRPPYVAFLSGLLPSLAGYSLTVERMVSDGAVVMVELVESMEIDGALDVTREVLAFDLDADDLITRIEIFIQRPG